MCERLRSNGLETSTIPARGPVADPAFFAGRSWWGHRCGQRSRAAYGRPRSHRRLANTSSPGSYRRSHVVHAGALCGRKRASIQRMGSQAPRPLTAARFTAIGPPAIALVLSICTQRSLHRYVFSRASTDHDSRKASSTTLFATFSFSSLRLVAGSLGP